MSATVPSTRPLIHRRVLRRLMGAIGCRPERAPSPEVVLAQQIAAGRVSMGAWSYGTPRVVVHRGDTAAVRIGKYCSIARGVEIFVGGNHRTDWVSTYPFRLKLDLPGALEDGHPATRGDVVIGNDVWIGAGAVILSGVEIGDGAVVGARAVVSTNVRPYGIVVGNPGVERRRRFDDAVVDRLLATAWWDWPDEKVLEAVPHLCSADIEAFLAYAASI